MAREDVAAICEAAGIPYAYRVWPAEMGPEGVPYPHLRYFRSGTRRVAADNSTLAIVDAYTLVLVSKAKDDAAESAVESALAGAGAAVSGPEESWLASEGLHQVSWEVELLR